MDNRKVLVDGDRRVHVSPDGTCSIAEHYWLPGVYADVEAAWAAFDYDYAVLARITHHSVRGVGTEYRPMTLDELRAEATS